MPQLSKDHIEQARIGRSSRPGSLERSGQASNHSGAPSGTNVPEAVGRILHATSPGQASANAAGACLYGKSLNVLYLLTTFPLLSETFVKREVRALIRLNVKLDIFSLWGGESEFEGHRVSLFPKRKIVSVLWWLPYWFIRRPRAFTRLFGGLFARRPATAMEFGATMLGIAFALCHARKVTNAERRHDLIHAGWATMPATAAQLLSALTGIPFTFQANAYDIFRHGGDWLLLGKLEEAELVITSTDYAQTALIDRGASSSKLVTVRRGLTLSSPPVLPRSPRAPLRLLSIGRLVEKKGFSEQIALLAKLSATGLQFEARIIGAGPLEKELRAQVHGLGLDATVHLLGGQPFTACQEQYRWADVFLFTGKVADNGDRDGLPNVICEAMAGGVPVVSTPVSAVPEAICSSKTGVLIDGFKVDEWRDALLRLRDDDGFYLGIRDAARAWAQQNLDADVNARMLSDCFQLAAEGKSPYLKMPNEKKPSSPRKLESGETLVT